VAAEAKASGGFESLYAEFLAARSEVTQSQRAIQESSEYKALVEVGDSEGIAKMRAQAKVLDMKAFVAKFQAGADAHAGTETAVPYLTWIALNATKRKQSRAAVDELIDEHIQSEGLVTLAENAQFLGPKVGADRHQDILESLAGGSPHDLIQAHAIHAMALATLRDSKASEEDKAAALETMDEVVLLAEGSELAISASAYRFERERLQIGMLAPDIVADDLDGVNFKLSDYRGKVVVLDFWGDW
jgi:hypothetical protein